MLLEAECDDGIYTQVFSNGSFLEAGRDVDLNVDLNMSKRDEADSGREHFSVDPCVVFGRSIGGLGGLHVSKHVDLWSLSSSGQDLNVDVHKCVETGKVLHQILSP